LSQSRHGREGISYLDEPTSEVTNDICVRWNAPLVYVATYLDRRPSVTRASGSSDGDRP
jgi:hypothetical protein